MADTNTLTFDLPNYVGQLFQKGSRENALLQLIGANNGARIDYVLYTGGLIPTAAEIVRTSYDGRWPSDHYPITATFRYAANQQSE